MKKKNTKKTQTKENIREQLKKMTDSGLPEYKEIKRTYKKLKNIVWSARIKLFYLNPMIQTANLLTPLIFSFLSIELYLVTQNFIYYG